MNPPGVIVRFLHFNVKDKIWSRKYTLKGKTNPKNSFPIFLPEKLTKPDSDLLDYAGGLSCKKTSYNLVSQILINNENGVRTHNIVNTCDVDEIFASGKAIKASDKPEQNKKRVEDTCGGCEKNIIR